MKNLKNKMKSMNGITLIALVITIIILLILAGISIASLTGNGLFEKAKLAKEKQENIEIEENEKLGDYENAIEYEVVGSRDTVTISKEEYDMLKNANSYSTTEQVVGTWANEEKIYRKLYSVSSINIANNTDLASYIDNMANIKNIITAKAVGDTTYKTLINLDLFYYNGKLLALDMNDNFGSMKYIILEYTKKNTTK